MEMEITPQELKQCLDRGEAVRLIDVREPQEYQIARIEGGELVPMGEIPKSLPRLEAAAESETLILYCHHGMRSLNAVAWLRQQGLDECRSLAGGIDAWSLQIDPKVPRY